MSKMEHEKLMNKTELLFTKVVTAGSMCEMAVVIVVWIGGFT